MIEPLNDRLVVQRQQEKEEMRGGLYIPDVAKEKPQSGVVVAIGAGKMLESGQRVPVGVRIGETVLFGKYAGTEIKQNNVEYLILREDDVIGIVRD